MPGEVIATPNPAYGYGRLDILNAVQMALDPWQVVVTVKDMQGWPVNGATVTIRDNLTGFAYQTISTTNGTALIPDLYWGQYRLSVNQSMDSTLSSTFEIDPNSTPITHRVTAGGLKVDYRITQPQTHFLYFPIFYP
jgi:hypothetical protein